MTPEMDCKSFKKTEIIQGVPKKSNKIQGKGKIKGKGLKRLLPFKVLK